MSFWHSATFSNDGTKVLFTDEWGGGSAPRCRDTDKLEWGADALFTIENNKLKFHSYYKMPAPQTAQENCVAHNGSLIPIPGRDVMVQAWYQGGLSVFDWTDIDHPKEIAFFDRGPVRRRAPGQRRLVVGVLVQRRDRQLRDRARPRHLRAGAEPAHLAERDRRGEDGEVRPTGTRRTSRSSSGRRASRWRARTSISSSGRTGSRPATIASARTALASAEKQSGAQRKTALTQLASQLDTAAGSAGDQAKVKLLSSAVTDLANAQK